MAPYGIQITMSTTWHGKAEEFSNVFHYDLLGSDFDEAKWTDLINQLVADMKPIFATEVTFVRARVFGPTNGLAVDNVMKHAQDLSGTGVIGAGGPPMFPESSIVGSFYLGRSAKGFKIFLRKYLHVGRFDNVVGAPVATLEGRAALTIPQKGLYTTFMNNIKNYTIGLNTPALCTPKGQQLPIASDPAINDYVRTRQFRRGSKRKKVVV